MSNAALTEITLRIDGMHCGSCIRRVSQAIGGAGPFIVEEVRLGAARFVAPLPLSGESSGTGTAVASAVAALARAGFAARADE